MDKNELEIPGRLTKFELNNQGSMITSKFTLRVQLPGQIQTFLRGLHTTLNTDPVDKFFHVPVAWKSIVLPIERRVQLTFLESNWGCEDIVFHEIKVLQNEEKGGTYNYTYDLTFEKEYETRDEHLSSCLKQKDEQGRFTNWTFLVELSLLDLSKGMED